MTTQETISIEAPLTHTLTCTSGVFTVIGSNHVWSLSKVLFVLYTRAKEGNVAFYEDGSARITYDFGQEVTLSPETVRAIQKQRGIPDLRIHLHHMIEEASHRG